MKQLEGILKLIENEFNAIITNGKFRSREEIDSVYKLIDIVKDIYCIWEMEEDPEENYSYNRYDDGYSMARGRRNAKRDSMGRYSREYDREYDRMNRRYSKTSGKTAYIEELREMMENAPDEQIRNSVQRMIQQLEQN